MPLIIITALGMLLPLVGTRAMASSEVLQSPLNRLDMRRSTKLEVAGVVPLQLDREQLDRIRDLEHVTLLDFPVEFGQSLDLHLHRREITRPWSRIVSMRKTRDGRIKEVPLDAPDIVLLGGTVIGVEDSLVSLAIDDTGVQGYMKVGTHQYIVATKPGFPPMIYRTDLAGHLVDLAEHFCSTPDPADPVGHGTATASLVPGECREISIALETDYELLGNVFGGNVTATLNYLAALMSAINEIYVEQLNVHMYASYIRLWETPDDPWTQDGGTGDQLGEFRNYWAANMNSVQRDLAHFISGRSLGGGVAWLPGLCGDFAYALSANINGSFPIPIEDLNDQNWDLMVVAHEFGHNFGAPHTHSIGVDGCGNNDCSQLPGTIMSYCHLCSGGLSNILLEFHPANRDNMWALLDSVDCDYGGFSGPPLAVNDTVTTTNDTGILLDVLRNDIEANCEPITLVGFDSTSSQGATISLSEGSGPDGRDQLLYEPNTSISGTDTFEYVIRNAALFPQEASATVSVDIDSFRPAENPTGDTPGIRVDYYQLEPLSVLPDFDTLTPIGDEIQPEVDFSSTGGEFINSGLSDDVGAVFSGWITVDTPGFWTFYLESDDGSRLLIGDEVVVDNDGLHPMQERQGDIGLEAGTHAIRIEFFERGGGAGIIARWAGEGVSKQVIPASAWSHGGEIIADPDFNDDGRVDGEDLGVLLGAWGTKNAIIDLDGNLLIDGGDLGVLLGAWTG